MKIKIIIGTVLIANTAQAHPRVTELQYKIQNAYGVQIQTEAKYRKEKNNYEATKAYTEALRQELKLAQKRINKGIDQARYSQAAAYQTVGLIDDSELQSPVMGRIK